MSRVARLALPSALLLCAGAVGLGTAPAQAMRGGRPVVTIGNHFLPAEIAVPQGQAIWWSNLDPWQHDITADNGMFREESTGGTLLSVPGVERLPRGLYPYTCSVHDGMVGILRIT